VAEGADDGKGGGQLGGLRLVPPPGEARGPSAPDPEMKEILDDMHHRYRVQRERTEGGPDDKDAA
jgi:hypothetical protein